eukprot:TRINITY_DN74369_c0_g1_i1.p1 TRINITY_DN74369_c0_g1~~TRINITY_DN74369_c0_g1_i1.p1  ORF type:complete len:782 (+),score=82.66 TRINITY_DN74369_c0_g1_i1:69-2414(+)
MGFREVLACELVALEKSLLAACEREVLQATEEAAELARARLSAEEAAETRRFELEVQRLRAENAELVRCALRDGAYRESGLAAYLHSEVAEGVSYKSRCSPLEMKMRGPRAMSPGDGEDVEASTPRGLSRRTPSVAALAFVHGSQSVNLAAKPLAGDGEEVEPPTPRGLSLRTASGSFGQNGHSAQVANSLAAEGEEAELLLTPRGLSRRTPSVVSADFGHTSQSIQLAKTLSNPADERPITPMRRARPYDATGDDSLMDEYEASHSSQPLKPRRNLADERPITPMKGYCASTNATEDDNSDLQRTPRGSKARQANHSPSPPVSRTGTGAQRRDVTPSKRSPQNALADECTARLQTVDVKNRINYDKRTLRRMHRDPFVDAIRDWKGQHKSPGVKPPASNPCQVFVRARPLFDHERQQGEFEAVSAYEDWGELVIHNCLLHSDLVRMYINHHGFGFTRVFGPAATNESVYAECGGPLVSHALGGQLATLFMFGQTGSGKTYTMDAILRSASCDIFRLPSAVEGKAQVRIKAFEILGRKCIDLLADERVELRLMEDEDGQTNVVGATELLARTTEECRRTVLEALSGRTTAGHGRNDESSRSHCICIIQLPSPGGSLVLVDCAGTERRQDTEQHSSERVRESADINSSLHCLKECIRRWQFREMRGCSSRSKLGASFLEEELEDGLGDERKRPQVRVPYRNSQLTRVLHESFTRQGSRLFAIGTVSPATLDSEHSLATLRTLNMLQTDPSYFELKVDVNPVAAAPQPAMRRDRSAGTLRGRA